MGCFLACFGGPKERRRRRRSPKRTLPVTPSHELYKALRQNPSLAQLALNHDSPKKLLSDKAIGDSLPGIREIPEKGSPASYRKKVTFDLNVTTYEDPKHCDDEANEVIESEEEERELVGDGCSSQSNSFPVNHRYQNCEISDEDGSELEDDDEYEDCDSDEEREDEEVALIGANEEESYDSYFSLPIDKEQPSLQEVNSSNPNRAPSPDRKQQQQPTVAAKYNARDRSQYVHAVLNPVENLSQWKEVKVRAIPVKNPKKENINVEPIYGSNRPQMPTDAKQIQIASAKQEISVDASLSNWLVSPDNSTIEGPQESYSHRSNSPISREERPILGALTVDDIKQSSATCSPRRSPSKSPDEMPILGTVGTYWNCKKSQGVDSASSNKSSNEVKGIPNATSKYREDKRVNWNSIPFEVRLERALKQDAA